MKATRELIDAFRVTADRIESGEYKFDWWETEHCWCGCLAQTVLNLNAAELYDLQSKQPNFHRCWSILSRERMICSTTGLPMNKILRVLHDIGITTTEDINNIEHLKDNDGKSGHCYKEYAGIQWMRDKADQLEKQLLNENVITTNKVVQVQSVGV